jgi:hypothetical protein
MLISTDTSNELKALRRDNSPTKEYFIDGIEKENIEFWTI